MKIQTINPATEQLLAEYDCLGEQAIIAKLLAGHQAYSSWKKTPFDLRHNLMLQLADLLSRNKEDLAQVMCEEMGKPITAGYAEIDKCSWVCTYYANHAESFLAPRSVEIDKGRAMVFYRPLGLVFGIMPWNFPFWQVFRFAVPTIMAGNGALLKHAPISCGTGNRIEALFREAGFPEHLFQHLIVDNEGASAVIKSTYVSGVTLTGSERAGSSVASQAGHCLKKSVLELGGSDPYVILADADLDLAAHCIVASRLNNSGQVCIAAKRIIVVKSIAEELTQKIMEEISTYKMGDPMNLETQIGPLARKDLRDNLHNQVEKSIKQGAKLLLGGIIPEGMGFYYPPTVLSNVKPGMSAFDEELFGPVLSICAVENEDEAISFANRSQYGLGAAVFTRNLHKGEWIAANEIEAGVCFVNSFVASDPRLPFGGIKQSGYGRELSREGILEFVNTKTVAISDS
ncbi:NAD-dependent succinate-semialdehyde dehydrogenase [Legionella worsleiensis]|uniref:Succinate semialdehyde dehydrogenase n=1 Tax=Legionella worsleiensis TaxID=45076 RepID=A0A0W1A6L1_9GAMM|nr:NAD-dependent succinate-semialdehyde dehydrogenase [Legionella worsleiensis]KTD76948.1 succinate semialdehyde dehydrogenase [Legionella worsleiensis]STY33381.1 succinate semialdehyde dehydrogenase [Legionella worsleiensis]